MSAPKKEAPAKDAPKDGAAAEAPKKKLPIKTIALVAGIMVAEAVVVVAVFSALSPKQSQANAGHAEVESSDAEMTKEVQVVEEKFQNNKSGRAFIWDLIVTVQIKNKHAEQVEALVKARAAEIKQEIGRIVANADDSQLKEPNRETLLRQTTALLIKIIGTDEKSNEPLVQKVIIPRCRGFPAEF